MWPHNPYFFRKSAAPFNISKVAPKQCHRCALRRLSFLSAEAPAAAPLRAVAVAMPAEETFVRSMLGAQTVSSKASAPLYSFGGSNDRWYTRKMAERHANFPAPGAYNV